MKTQLTTDPVIKRLEAGDYLCEVKITVSPVCNQGLPNMTKKNAFNAAVNFNQLCNRDGLAIKKCSDTHGVYWKFLINGDCDGIYATRQEAEKARTKFAR